METKIIAGAIAGAVTTILVWVAQSFGHTTIPPEVAAAITTLITVITGYMVPNSDS